MFGLTKTAVIADDAAAEEAGEAPSLLASLQAEFKRRAKLKKTRRSKGIERSKALKNNEVTDIDSSDSEDDEVEDDTLGALREINVEHRLTVGTQKAREGISQTSLREQLAKHGVPESQTEFLFAQYINVEEEEEEEDNDDYDAFKEAEQIEVRSRK